MVTNAKISPRMVNPRDIAGNAEKEEELCVLLTGRETADQTGHLTQSQSSDTGPTSPSTDPIAPGAWQCSHRNTNVSVTGVAPSARAGVGP